VPIAWIVRRVCVGDCRLCACSVCVCVRVRVCVCVVCIHVCAMLPAQGSRCLAGGGMLSTFDVPARSNASADSERNSSACVLSGVSRCGTCMCTELCRAGWVVAASMCCETTHLCVRLCVMAASCVRVGV
jgi:hypothetical protein